MAAPNEMLPPVVPPPERDATEGVIAFVDKSSIAPAVLAKVKPVVEGNAPVTDGLKVPPLTVVVPEYVLAPPKTKVPAAVDVTIKFELVPDIIPFKAYEPVFPILIDLVTLDPKATGASKVKLPVPAAKSVTFPKLKFPPTVIAESLPTNVLAVALLAEIAPPFKTNGPGVAFPPKAFTPPAIQVPALMVKPPPNADPAV